MAAKAPVTLETPPEEPVKERMVRIRLPIIPGVAKQEAQFVRVNTRTWVIPRGVEMEVPECVVEVLEHAENAKLEAIKYQESISV